ncbi:MAG: hypothetical protein AB7S78_10535 [Candidatus Omnitrophota bacterium]
MKKLAVLFLFIVGAFLVYCALVFLEGRSIKNVRPNLSAKPVNGMIIKSIEGENAKATLLNYSFWILHSDYSFVPEKLSILKNIADEYKNLGIDDKHKKLMELYARYKKDTTGTSYLVTSIPSYQKKWDTVQLLVKSGKYEEAVTASQKDPYALANTAHALYEKTGDYKMALELVGIAIEEFKTGNYANGHLLGIAGAYSGLKEYKKATDVVMLSQDTSFWSDTTLPMIKYYSDQQDFDTALYLVTRTENKYGQAEALLYISQSIKNDGTPLNPKYIKMLDIVLK